MLNMRAACAALNLSRSRLTALLAAGRVPGAVMQRTPAGRQGWHIPEGTTRESIGYGVPGWPKGRPRKPR